jgi:hypothetical protein
MPIVAPPRAVRGSHVRGFLLLVVGVLVVSALWTWNSLRIRVPHLVAAPVRMRAVSQQKLDPAATWPERFPGQVAVLLTDPTDAALAPAHVLRAMGIPFFITRDIDAALKHRLVLIYPSIEANNFSEASAQKLREFVNGGGTVFAQNALWGPVQPLFGFTSSQPLRTRHRMRFDTGSYDSPLLRYLDRAEERELPLGSPKIPEVIWSNGYSPAPGAEVMARFDDGSAAMLHNVVGKGETFTIGVSLSDVVLRPMQNRDYEAERWYVNHFSPGADAWLLLLRAWYESAAPTPVRLATLPSAARGLLVLSHDIDWEYAVGNARKFEEMESRHGVSSTFFMQTKYLKDANSRAFFLEANLPTLRAMKSAGADIESHSVIHSLYFNQAPLGRGDERFNNYRARTTDPKTMPRGLTAMGETCVSKSLLDGEVGGSVTVFRAGHLRVPPALPEALVRCGYDFDSSFTAGDVLSSFPYVPDYNLDFEHPTQLYEFPVNIEDEEQPELRTRIDQALELIQANADNGAPAVLLIHPSDVTGKLAAEEDLLNRLPKETAVTNLLEFARFWRARDRVRWQTREIGDGIEFDIEVPEAISGLTFDLPREPKRVTGTEGTTIRGTHLVLPQLKAGTRDIFEVHWR